MEIEASAVWHGNQRECEKLYLQFARHFGGSFTAIRRHYGWTKRAMLDALRQGRVVESTNG